MITRSRVIVAFFVGSAVACADAPTIPSAPSSAASPHTPAQPAAPTTQTLRTLDVGVLGSGVTTEWVTRTPSGEHRGVSSVILGSTRDLPVGMPRDTMFQFAFSGFPAVGERIILPPANLVVMEFGGMPALVNKVGDESGYAAGTPDLMIFVWPAGRSAPVREIAQSGPATLTITEYVAPAELQSDGVLRGTIEYLGDEWMREWAPDGTATMRKTGDQVRVTGRIDVRWSHRRSSTEVPSGE